MLAVVAGHGAVGGFRLDGVAALGHQHRGHEAERAETLRHRVRLHIAVVVLTGPNEAARPFEGRGNHIVDQPMLVGDARRLEAVGEFSLEHLLEDVLEPAVVLFQDGIFGRQVDRPAEVEAVIHARPGKTADRVIDVVHAHGAAGAVEPENLEFAGLPAIVRFELHGQPTRTGHTEVGCPILVAEGMAADDDGLGPARHQPRNIFADDRLAEDRAADDIADGAVWRLPHLLEIELLDSRLVRGDGRALDAYPIFLDRLRRGNRHRILGGIPVLHRKIVILQIDVQVGQDQSFLDKLPDDPGHFIPVQLDHRVFNVYLFHYFTHPFTQISS